MLLLAGFFLSYLVGAIPTGWIIPKIVRGIEIRDHGSGNVGATNVGRVIGKKWGFTVFFLDVFKGLMAVSLIGPIFWDPSLGLALIYYRLLLGITAVLGHNWTIFLKFKGGKGVATSLGISVGLFPLAAISALGVWFLVLWPFRYISLASVVAAISFPLWICIFYRQMPEYIAILAITSAKAVLIIYTHRSNIGRLLKGTESKVGKKSKS